MAKYSRIQKLTKQEKQRLLIALCQAITSVKNTQEAAKLLTDLLSPAEIEMIAKRLEIAKLLIEGKNYEAIRREIKVGFSTIARVNTWLNLAGDGFKIAIARRRTEPKEPTIEERYDPFSWYNIGRRYPTHIWPLVAIEEFLKAANKHEKSKLLTILQSMESKRQLFTKEANNATYKEFSNKLDSFRQGTQEDRSNIEGKV